MALDGYLEEQNRRGRLSGSVLVRRRGTTLLDRGYGLADRAQGRPNTPDTALQIASVSKQFTAAAILLLQEWGALSVHDRIAAWVPGCPEAWQPITVHHLLTHTSGIGHWRDLPELSLYEPNTRENLLRIFQQHPLKFPPGHRWAYSSPAYVLVAHIVEQVSGEPYASFLHRRIFQPLGMASTGAGNQAPHVDQQALGYAGEKPLPSFELETVGIGAGDVWSTTRDLARWDAALGAPGLLSADSLQAMFTPHVAVPEDSASSEAEEITSPHYGYGWFIGEVRGHLVWFHPGDNAGYNSINARLEDDDGVIVLLSNDEQTNIGEIALHLMAAVLGDVHDTSSTGQ